MKIQHIYTVTRTIEVDDLKIKDTSLSEYYSHVKNEAGEFLYNGPYPNEEIEVRFEKV